MWFPSVCHRSYHAFVHEAVVSKSGGNAVAVWCLSGAFLPKLPLRSLLEILRSTRSHEESCFTFSTDLWAWSERDPTLLAAAGEAPRCLHLTQQDLGSAERFPRPDVRDDVESFTDLLGGEGVIVGLGQLV